jgi:LysR family cys regulon transcriptional activator
MNLRQLRYLVAVADAGFNISHASRVLHTSQPGVSTQLRDLEHELDVKVFVRHRNRIVGATEPGKAILSVARRMLRDAASIKAVSREFNNKDVGSLVVATTHIYARYVLVDIIDAFRRDYGQVQLTLRQGNPQQIAEWIVSGEADIGIAAEPPEVDPDLFLLPGFQLSRSILAQRGHPLLDRRELTLSAIAQYPMVMLDPSFAGGSTVLKVFEQAGLRPEIVLRATDADVVKAYVAKGLGISILPTIAFDPVRDAEIRALDATPWFVPTVARVELRRDSYLRPYMYEFLEMLTPELKRGTVDRLMGAEG